MIQPNGELCHLPTILAKLAKETSVQSKLCHTCKQEKPVSEFVKNKSHPDGLMNYCKACNRVYTKGLRDQDRVAFNAKSREYLRHNAKHAERTRAWSKAHPESRRETYKRYDKAHAEKKHADRQKRYAAHKEKDKLLVRLWRKLHPLAHRALSHLYATRKRGATGRYTERDVIEKLHTQGFACFYCNQLLGENHTVDHFIPLSRGGSNGPENIVVACPHCNFSKGKKLPHEFMPDRFASDCLPL